MAISIAQGSSSLNQSAVSILFLAGHRPDAAAITALASDHRDFAISFSPADASVQAEGGTGWLELICNGLTFDLTGLRPAAAEPIPTPRQRLALADTGDLQFEAITLRPGPHLAGSSGILPIIRTLAWLGAILSQMDGVHAVSWHPAQTWCGQKVFEQGVIRWVEGGVFPGLILVSLLAAPDGGFQSEGLAALIGQELRLEPELVADRADGAKLAVRLLDFLVVHGKVFKADRIVGPDGQPLRLEPSENARFVRVWRG